MLGLSGCQTTDRTVSDDRFIRFADEVLFSTPLDGRRDRLVKWEGPFRFSVEGEPAFRTVVVEALTETAQMADIEPIHQREGEAPIHVVQAESGCRFPVNNDLVDCYVHREGSGHRITRARIHIAHGDPERTRACAYHEAFHVLGFGHSTALASVMSPFHGQTKPSRWDIMLALLVMLPEIPPGTERLTVLEAAAAALPHLRAWPAAYSPKPIGERF